MYLVSISLQPSLKAQLIFLAPSYIQAEYYYFYHRFMQYLLLSENYACSILY